MIETSLPTYVVGIGASRSSREALRELVQRLSAGPMAFVIAHQDGLGADISADFLRGATRLQVTAATDGQRLAANTIYVVPPGQSLRVDGDTLRQAPADDPRTPRPIIDVMLQSLAQSRGTRAVGVLLTDSATDGKQGLREIKATGGITFVAQAGSANDDTHVGAVFADYSMPAHQIADELLRLCKQADLHTGVDLQRDGLSRLFTMMRDSFGIDLSYYKPSTLERRIGRRMALQQLETLADYVQFLERSPEALGALYRDLFIGVTNFFRDNEPFEALKTAVFPRMMQDKQPGDTVRLWSPGCSTGEELYTLAITLLEYLGPRASEYKVQLFGTDLDASAIQTARRGVYLDTIALDVSADRLQRFFTRSGGTYQINRGVRSLIVFSTQDLTSDAPFSQLDLISCRNVLIYLQPEVQRRVLRVFHYALSASGCLMLGNSETVGDCSDMFAIVDRANKIFAKRSVVAQAPREPAFAARRDAAEPEPRSLTMRRPLANIQQIADRKVLERYGPPGIIVNEAFEIVQFRGRTGGYIDPVPGASTFNLMKMARPELLPEIRHCIQEAEVSQQATRGRVKIRERDETRVVNIDVVPLVEPDTNMHCYLVVFRDEALQPISSTEKRAIDAATSAANERVTELERELGVMKEYLQATIEELEAANEELKAANDEQQSANAELQSSNEELETAKEELQATNEELTTANEELNSRMLELTLATDDVQNILAGVGEVVVLVDIDRRIRKFTHSAERILNLTQSDVGRPASILDRFLGHDVETVVTESIDTLQRVRCEVRGTDDESYMLKVTPYRTSDLAIRGAVIVLGAVGDG